MKKFLTVIAVFTALAFSAEAQIWSGITVGMNQAGLSGSGFSPVSVGPAYQTAPNFSGITRLQLGIFTMIPIKKWLYFNPGINFSQRGGVQKDSTFTSYIDIPPGWNEGRQRVQNLDFTYIDIPLLMRASIQMNNPEGMYPYENSVHPWFVDFMVGVQPSYMITNKNSWSETLTVDSSTTLETVDYTAKNKGSAKLTKVSKIDFALVFGMGIRWKIARKSQLYLDFRYSMFMLNVNAGNWDYKVPKEDDPSTLLTKKPTVKNNGMLTFSVGYITHFHKRRYFGLQ